MGTKRKLYRPPAEAKYDEPAIADPEESQEEAEFGMKDMLIGSVIVIIILIIALISPNF